MPTTEKQATGSKNPETKKKESMQKESNPYGIDEWAKQDFEPSNRNQRKDFLEKFFGFLKASKTSEKEGMKMLWHMCLGI